MATPAETAMNANGCAHASGVHDKGIIDTIQDTGVRCVVVLANFLIVISCLAVLIDYTYFSNLYPVVTREGRRLASSVRMLVIYIALSTFFDAWLGDTLRILSKVMFAHYIGSMAIAVNEYAEAQTKDFVDKARR